MHRYSRIPSHFPSYTHSIDVLPAMTNCSHFATIDTCVTFPGCLFCLGMPSSGEMRILSSAQNGILEYYYGQHDHSNSNSNVASRTSKHLQSSTTTTTSTSSRPAGFTRRRALFANIVPLYHDDIKDYYLDEHGHCGTGFTSETACVIQKVDHTFSSSAAHHFNKYYFYVCSHGIKTVLLVQLLFASIVIIQYLHL
jgi:hypothetical protein